MNFYKAFIHRLKVQQIFNIREQQALAISTFQEYAKSSAPFMDGNLQQAHFDVEQVDISVEDTPLSTLSPNQSSSNEDIQTSSDSSTKDTHDMVVENNQTTSSEDGVSEVEIVSNLEYSICCLFFSNI